MGATFTAQNGIVHVTHIVQGPTVKIKKTYNDAAYYFWHKGKGDHGTDEAPIVWDDLADQDKLDLVHAEFIKWVREAAKAGIAQRSAVEARVEAEEEFVTSVEIEDV